MKTTTSQIGIIVLLAFSFIAIGYLIGSILSASLIKHLKGTDFRKTSSGNMGATNVMRVHGKVIGFASFLFDFWKSIVAIFISMVIYWSSRHAIPDFYNEIGFIIYFTGGAVIVGHCFPLPWIFFKIFYWNDLEKANNYTGGKGSSSMAGLFTAISPILLPIGVLLFWFILFTSRYVSLSAVLSIIILTFLILIPELNFYYMLDFPGFDPSIIDGGLNSYTRNLSISFSSNEWYLFTIFLVAFMGTGIVFYKHLKNLNNIYFRTERQANFIWHKKNKK